ncbi:MAG: DEAD/DEAH box helicase, partial [Ezakiella sp.]
LMAIDDIKADMESKKPMDRLLLGDVGYGKTEVALRAAFKAIMDGKQVAMLTPTTLLAEQHTKTAEERFKNFPVRIRNLSRFRTKKEITKTVKELALGQVDIVIGTHRLLSKDVKFKDLGLLIIDEEQRFGVKHKERIKSLAEDVDVLTLSATPIPRTLSMSLSGIRSMSVIEEPPHNRIPVQTYVLEYSENIIRSAILKEINRGGQTFFLYNDVKSMEVMKRKLEELVPEARFFIANGQMSERELEDVFYRFENKESDVLITSTIIETGMDLPNVNTLIVYNSDRFGLSTLYQLRGRVGRSNRLAYAYFTYDKSRSISEKAIKRLMAMKEFTDFGSGYKIAMRDLELRGAGNVLGLSQSGHMAEVGYELYMKYLNYAIGELQGKPVRETLNTKVDFMVESAVPEGFIEDTYIRMELYRRISEIQTFKEKDELADEIIDRFGDIPEALINLMNIGLIKNIASKHFVKSIIENNNIIRMEYAPEMLDEIDMTKLLKDFPDGLRFDSKLPIIRISSKDNAIETVYKFFKSAFGV